MFPRNLEISSSSCEWVGIWIITPVFGKNQFYYIKKWDPNNCWKIKYALENCTFPLRSSLPGPKNMSESGINYCQAEADCAWFSMVPPLPFTEWWYAKCWSLCALVSWSEVYRDQDEPQIRHGQNVYMRSKLLFIYISEISGYILQWHNLPHSVSTWETKGDKTKTKQIYEYIKINKPEIG